MYPLHLRDSVEWYLHYVTVEFKMQIYIYIAPVEDSFILRCNVGGET
jgi:hypothetical protein